MGVKLFSINHSVHGLKAVEILTPLAQNNLEKRIFKAVFIQGVLLISTCNRIEILVDTTDTVAAETYIENIIYRELATVGESPIIPKQYEGKDLVLHMCQLASGMKSLVVGEREIAGQMRYSVRRARRIGTISAPISDIMDTAFRAARQVELETGLSGMGRSIATIALDHAAQIIENYPQAKVILFGTGSYAGAVVTQLHNRGCKKIFVHSQSGRAREFAHGRGLIPIESHDLEKTIKQVDMVVSCRGIGAPVVTVEHIRSGLRQRSSDKPLIILDLAITRDIDPAVAELANVEFIDLSRIQLLVPDITPQLIARAQQITIEIAQRFIREQEARVADPLIITMRQKAEKILLKELAKLPKRPLNSDDFEKALRHLTHALLHTAVACVKNMAEYPANHASLGELSRLLEMDE